MTGPVVVLGDTLLDRDVEGLVNRLCPDSPVPVLDETSSVDRPGGAGLAAVFAAAQGAEVALVTARRRRRRRGPARHAARRRGGAVVRAAAGRRHAGEDPAAGTAAGCCCATTGAVRPACPVSRATPCCG